MLKIKKDVNLKELYFEPFIVDNEIDNNCLQLKDSNICILKSNREIFISDYEDELDDLYDLIKADLVEKVED